jgi:parallel beta-helix repeat protein
MKTRMFFSLLIATLLVLAGWEAQAQGFVKKVNCTKGQTITRALQGLDFIPITIQIKGTCNENVEIVRDDVTLIPDPLGGTVIGLDPNVPTINVGAFRTVIDGLTISGGANGILVRGGATIRNCTVQNTGASGISFFHGGNGTVDHCTVQSSGGFGVSVEGGSATVINSTISSNTNAGISVAVSGSARIGVTDRNQYAGNTISNNQGSGILISHSGSAHIGGNTISGNGTNPNSLFGFFGVLISSASANLVGNNRITGNSGCGVYVDRSGVRIGNPGFGLPITGAFANVITGNGATLFPNGGIFGNQGALLQIESTTINGNTGNGINLQLRSTARIYDDTINNNTGNGIFLAQGAALSLQNPTATVAGNTLFGLECGGTESSFTGNTSGISGNTGGQVSLNCSGF